MATIALNNIRFDGETQMRVEINGDAIHDYAEAIKSGLKLPPVKLFHDGCDYWIGDGYHRWHAASQAGLNEIEADIVKGTRRDAVLYAASANRDHGLRRTSGDKHKAVKTLLLDAEWSQWSDRAIAEKVGVSHTFVAGVRKQLATVASSRVGDVKRRGRDGKSRSASKRATESTKKAPPVASAENVHREPEQKPELLGNIYANGFQTPSGAASERAREVDGVATVSDTCPRGGVHNWTEEEDDRFCSKCKEPAPQQEPDDEATAYRRAVELTTEAANLLSNATRVSNGGAHNYAIHQLRTAIKELRNRLTAAEKRRKKLSHSKA